MRIYHLKPEMRMLLYGQLQEGLSYSLMELSFVSGARGYQELRIAAKKAEQRLTELKNVTGFVKRGFPHTSNLPTLTINNFRLKTVIYLKFGKQ